MYIFCGGMYRSGSTWQYNVVCHLVEMFGVGRRIGYFIDGNRFCEYAAQNPSGAELLVLKTHDEHPEFAKALTENRALGVYMYRDMRDVAFSLAHKCDTTFDHVVGEERFLHKAIQNDEFWRTQPRVVCQKYEEVIGNPVLAILELAKHLGLSPSMEIVESLAREYSFEANVARTRALAEQCESLGLDLHDSQNTRRHDDRTLLSWNHMREGQPGGWRDEATPEQIVALLAACGDWLIRRGYEQDCSWAWAPGDASNTAWGGAESSIRGLAQSLERDGKQILTLRREVVELNAQYHELREILSRVTRLETPSLFVLRWGSRLQAMLARHPRLHAILKSLFRGASEGPPSFPSASSHA